MKRKDLLTKLLLLCMMIVGSVNAAWADTVIKTIDFSQSEWSSVTFSQGNTTTPDVHNGVTFYAKNSSNQFSLSNGELTFPANMGSQNYALGFPVDNIVGGIITIKVYNGNNATRVRYSVKDGGTAFSTSDFNSYNSLSSDASPCSFDVSGLSNTNAYIYIGRHGSNAKYQKITKIEVLTPELIELNEDLQYLFYNSQKSEASELISAASLSSFVRTTFSYNLNSNNNTSSIDSPIDFSNLGNGTFYRISASSTDKIVIGGLSRVKSIRLYGNGSYNDGTINVSVTNLSGDGDEMTITGVNYENSRQTIKEYSTGDLSLLEGYDVDTYYLYTITFAPYTGSATNFSLWGLYIEAMPSSYTVTYNYNGGSGSIANSTGASITLSNGTGFTAPSGYTLAGWNTDAHGVGTSYTLGQTNVKADLTLYAVWTQSGTIDDNGGSTDGEYTATYNKAGISITTEPVNSSYAIKGYYEAGTGDALVSTTDGELQTSTTYTDEDGYWTNTGSAPTLYAQWENTHELTVSVNDADMGSAEADKTTLAEDATTTVTAVAETGYKFRSWSVSGTGAELSSETANPVTFTMGSADATVTANFSALETYTITYAKGANGTGDDITDGEKTEDADFTLSSSTYTYANHLQTGWATFDGGEKAFELGGTYTANADLTLYPYWIEQYTLTYDANGGEGGMSSNVGTGSITLTANTFTKTGYTFLGWATSQANADAGIVTYVDKASYSLTANATLYAVWAENYFTFTPSKTSGSLSAGEVVTTTAGGVMDVVDATSLSYTSSGLNLGSNSSKLRVVLYDYLKTGSVILVKVYYSSGTSGRGVKLYNSSDEKSQNLTGTSATTVTLKYTVTENDGFIGTKEFHIMRTNGVYLQSLTVTDCQPGGIITDAGWSTYSSNKRLDLLSIRGGTAYIATRISDDVDYVIVKPCTDIVAAEEGLMIKGTPGATFTIDKTDEAVTFAGTNLMKGLPNGGTVSYGAGNYVFGWPSKSESPDEDCGFYYVNTNAVTLPNGRAYLTTGDVGSARLSIVFDDEIATGVADVRSKMEDIRGEYFDLQGRRISQPTKGLYIVNGKKVVVK